LLVDQWELNMPLENLTNDAFANKMADYYHTHIGAAEFKSIRAEAKIGNVESPLWLKQPFMQRGIQRGKDNPSGKINFITAPVIDTARITKFMGSPKGLLFIANQAGLQMSNPKGEFLVPGPINAGRIYNPLATIAQIPAGALGIHVDRHALGPLNPEAINYEKRIKAKTLLGQNRLVGIANQLNVGHFKSLVKDPGDLEAKEKPLILKIADKIKNSNWYLNRGRSINAMSGLGGPNSFFGIGFTTHRTSTTVGLNGSHTTYYNPPSGTSLPVGDPGPDSYSKSKPDGVYNEYAKSKPYLFDPSANDYKPSKNSTEVGNPGPDSYIKKNPEGQIKKEADSKPYLFDPSANDYKPSKNSTEVGNPGPDSYSKIHPKGQLKETDYQSISPPAGSDRNPLAKYKSLEYGEIVKAGKASGPGFKSFRKGEKYSSDASGYARLGLIDYGQAEAGKESDLYGVGTSANSDYITLMISGTGGSVKFRTYGLGSISDNTSFSWSEVKYAGRTMAQQKFDSVSRDASHDLMIVSFTSAELKSNYNKLNTLYKLASPSIDASGLPTAPLCKLTLGALYTNQNVVIDKITFSVDDATSWDIDNGTGAETAGAELPMVIKLSLGYKLLTNRNGGFFSSTTNYWKSF